EAVTELSPDGARLPESRHRPQAPLKVTTSVAFGSMWLAPRMQGFLDLYPAIQMHLILDDRELDLSMRQADVAIRLSPPRQPDLIQRHLPTRHVHAPASPPY